jgi:hypothetical protein
VRFSSCPGLLGAQIGRSRLLCAPAGPATERQLGAVPPTLFWSAMPRAELSSMA